MQGKQGDTLRLGVLPQQITSPRLLKSIISFALFLAVSGALEANAQPYEWRNTLTHSAECVSFNPLSRGQTIYCSSRDSNAVFRSDDGGMTWRGYNAGLPEFEIPRIMQIHCLESDTSVLIAVGVSAGVFRSTNGGQNWELVIENGGILGEAITWHRATDALYYGQNFMGPVWRSLDHGATWIHSAEADTIVLCTIAIEQGDRKRILAGSGDGGIALSDFEGNDWRIVYSEEDPNEVIRPEVPKIIWSTHSQNVVIASRWLSKDNALIRSLDAGETWTTIGPDLDRTWALEFDQRSDRTGALGPKRFWIGLFNRGLEPNEVNSIIETQNSGQTWLSSGLPVVEQVWMIKHDTTSDRLVAATEKGIFVTSARASVAHNIHSSPVRFTSNPAQRHTEIVIPAEEKLVNITLYDVTGRPAYSSTDLALDVSGLTAGFYSALITTNSTTHRLGLVVE